MKSKYPFNEDERPLKSRTKEELGSSYGSDSSRSPRGSLENNKNINIVHSTRMIDLSKVHFPMKELIKKNIMRDYEHSPKDSPRMKEMYKRLVVHARLYGEMLDGQDGLNCLGFPNVKLGEVDERVSDSCENDTPPYMSFDQMVEMNSPRMITPNGQEFPYGAGLTNEFIEKMKKKPSVVEKPIQIEMRSITNSHVIPLTEKLGFTDEIWNEPELMEEFMTWCVRIFFDLDGNEHLSIDCPVETYANVLLEPETIIVN